MELNEIINLIKLKKKHGLVKKVSEQTGVSMPTVRKYLDGDVINPKATLVIEAALKEISK